MPSRYKLAEIGFILVYFNAKHVKQLMHKAIWSSAIYNGETLLIISMYDNINVGIVSSISRIRHGDGEGFVMIPGSSG